MNHEAPKPDLQKLAVPSDRLTPEAIAAVDPHSHPDFAALGAVLSDEAMRTAICLAMRLKETTLIAKAFNAALFLPDPHPEANRKELIAALADDYRLFGLVTGPQLTEQLVRNFERAAVAQARAHGGQGLI